MKEERYMFGSYYSYLWRWYVLECSKIEKHKDLYGEQKVFDWLLEQKLTLYVEEKSKYDNTKQYG